MTHFKLPISPITAVEGLLHEIGEDPTREGLVNTPKRVVKALRELTEGYSQDPAQILSTTFEADYDQMVIVKDIDFWSLCEHHMLPFNGSVTVGYLPKGRVIGLSKIARLVYCYSRRLQIQEKMTTQIAKALEEHLQPLGVGVIVKGSHTCMKMRGVRSSGEMVTSCLLGEMRESGRAELLGLK